MHLNSDMLLARAGGLFQAGMALLYPEWCQLCDKERGRPEHGYVCGACRASVKYTEPPWCRCCGRPYQGAISSEFTCAHCMESEPPWVFARSSVLARDVVREAIHKYKYERQICLERFLAGVLVERAAPELGSGGWDAVVPVPLHPVKERERGFNQAETIAKHLAEALRLPLRKRLVRRVTPTRTQTQLTREERRENMRGAFAPVKQSASGLRLILVDDVFTTGATTASCARALLKGGAEAVCVWTVARGI